MRLSLNNNLLSIRSLFVSQAITRHFSSTIASDSLFRRISPLGDPKVSIVPVLDQWVKEGNTVNRVQLQYIGKELTRVCRYKHSLELSQWMTDKMYIPLSPGDVAIRLNLISKIYGIEQAENLFNNTAEVLKDRRVYGALLNCYARQKSVEKAEMLMQKIKDTGFSDRLSFYNIMLNLYYHMGDHEKMDTIMLEMAENDIIPDIATYSVRLSAYAAASDVEGINKIIKRTESSPRIVLDWDFYAVAAKAYLKVGLVDEAMKTMKKLEGLLMVTTNHRRYAFESLLRLSAEAGKKDELYRIWYLYKENEKIANKGYMCMLGALLKLDDIEGAEKIYEEWESSSKLSYDIRLPNLLIDAYCGKGLVEKAESLRKLAIEKGGVAPVDAWYLLAKSYLEDNQIPKAVEAMKKAISVCPPNWKLSKETLVTCVEYLEGKGDLEGADRFIKLLRDESIFSAVVHNRLMNYIKGEKWKIPCTS